MTLAIPLSSVKIRHEEKLGGRERRQQRGYYTSTGTQLDLGKEFVCGRAGPDTFDDAAVSGSLFETGLGLQAALSKSNTGAHDVFSGLYRIVFNCLAYRKNSATDRRVSQENAAELHVVQEVPSLRVIGDGLWQRVNMRKENWREARTERHPAGPGFSPHTCQGLASSAAHVHRSAQDPSPEPPLALA
jgi:hypothetical protein